MARPTVWACVELCREAAVARAGRFRHDARTGVARPVLLDRVAEPARRSIIKVGPLSLAALRELIKQRMNQSLSRHSRDPGLGSTADPSTARSRSPGLNRARA